MKGEQHRHECECRYLIAYVKEHGHTMWALRKESIAKKRGKAALDRLVADMELMRNKK